MNQLVTNALQHDSHPTAVVDMTAQSTGDEMELIGTDDGRDVSPVEAPVTEDERETDAEHRNGLGL